MRKILSIGIISVLTLFVLSGIAEDKKDFKYVGAAKCKTCHKKEKIGNQYGKWLEASHAKALESLSSEKSLKYAKENGIEDPTKYPKCLECHSTMATVDTALIDPKGKMTIEEGVSCESCHGPGSKYKKKKIMKDHDLSLANGLIVPDKKVCESCHNDKNPFFEGFDFDKQIKKVDHPIPEKKKG